MKLVKSLSLTFLLVTLSRGQIDFGANDRAEDERLQGVIEELCQNRPPNEYFRLSTESNCRDAVRCVQNDFAGGHTLAAVRCPTGLVFDLDGQTCNWAAQVIKSGSSKSKNSKLTPNGIKNELVKLHIKKL